MGKMLYGRRKCQILMGSKCLNFNRGANESNNNSECN